MALRADFVAGHSADPIMADVLVLQAEYEIPVALVLDFIDALIADQWPRHLQTQDQLIRFCYGVASTVGLMMCHLFGVKDPRAYPFAVDLGVAMQMTNICRDILEDAQRQRIYLPAEMLPARVNAHGLVGGDAEQRDDAYRAGAFARHCQRILRQREARLRLPAHSGARQLRWRRGCIRPLAKK